MFFNCLSTLTGKICFCLKPRAKTAKLKGIIIVVASPLIKEQMTSPADQSYNVSPGVIYKFKAADIGDVYLE